MYQLETTTADTYANVATASDSTSGLKADGSVDDITKYCITDGWTLEPNDLMKRGFGSDDSAFVTKEGNVTNWNPSHSKGFHLGSVKVVDGKRSTSDAEGKRNLDADGNAKTSRLNADNPENLTLNPEVVDTVYLFYERNYYNVNFHTNDKTNGDGTTSSTTAAFGK